MNTADIVADELATALTRHGINHHRCQGRPCGHVVISFSATPDAEKLIGRAVPLGGPGSLHDRATGSFETLTDLAEQGADPEDPRVTAALMAAWNWECYPMVDETGVVWIPSVELPSDDAAELAVNLNRLTAEVNG